MVGYYTYYMGNDSFCQPERNLNKFAMGVFLVVHLDWLSGYTFASNPSIILSNLQSMSLEWKKKEWYISSGST